MKDILTLLSIFIISIIIHINTGFVSVLAGVSCHIPNFVTLGWNY